MRRGLLAALVAMAVAACQDLPDVATEVCGNGVVETGEDCEATVTAGGAVVTQCGASDGDNACFFECVVGDLGAEPVDCPVGFACGADRRCRQAAGRFEIGASLDLAVDDVQVGDIDGDGFDDLVTGSGASIRVSFGSSQADLTSSLAVPVSTPELALEVGDLDLDGIDDILVATEPGVQAFLGAAGRALDPFSYPQVSFAPSASIAHAVAADIDPSTPAEEVVIAWGDRIGIAAVANAPATAITDLPAPGVGVPVSPGLAAPLAAGRLSRKRGDPDVADDTVELAIGYESRSTIHIYRASAGPLTTVDTGITIDLGAGVQLRPGSGMFFGYFDGDDCLDLVAHVGGAGGERLLVFRGTLLIDACTGALQTPGEVLTSTTADPLARVFAAADLDGDGITDLVLNSGIYKVEGTGPWTTRQVAIAHPGFEGAQIVDLNGDGDRDVAAFREGLTDVEVLINADGVFNRFVIATANSVQRLASGDFDGDLTGDLAIIELDSTDDEPKTSVGVAFGQFHGPPGPRVAMDLFESLAGVVSASVVGASGSLDAVDDLVVLQQRGDTMDATVLFGSGARAMTSPLILHVEDVASSVENPASLALGRFDDGDTIDLFTVGNAGTGFAYLGDGDGGFGDAVTASWIDSFEAGDALWATGDIDGDGDDEIAAAERFERRNLGSLVDVLLFGSDAVAGPPADLTLDTLDGFIGAHALWLVDLEGDDDLDLVLGLDPPISDLLAVGLRIGWNDGAGIGGLTAVGGAEGCFDAVALQLDGDPAPELIALCRIPGRGQLGLRRFDSDAPETLSGAADLLADIPGDRKTRLRVGDFDGNGLDDLAVLIQGGETADVRLLLQRDIHAQP